MKRLELPPLPYEANALEPVMSSEQLLLHHDKHHKAYVDAANELMDKLDAAKDDGAEIDYATIAKKLSFNIGGHVLHSLFWSGMRTPQEGNQPVGELKNKIDEQFGSFEKFWEAFYNIATTIEGSGWSALFYDKKTDRLLIAQIQNHNKDCFPGAIVLLAIDMWEHSFYVDYKNDKKTFAQNWAKIINWDEIEERYQGAK